jgi:hypothetical protein
VGASRLSAGLIAKGRPYRRGMDATIGSHISGRAVRVRLVQRQPPPGSTEIATPGWDPPVGAAGSRDGRKPDVPLGVQTPRRAYSTTHLTGSSTVMGNGTCISDRGSDTGSWAELGTTANAIEGCGLWGGDRHTQPHANPTRTPHKGEKQRETPRTDES